MRRCVRRVQKLRTEVDWGMRQDPAACRADAAIRLAERGFALAAALAAGEVPCRSAASAPATPGADDLSIRDPDASRGAAAAETSSNDRPDGAVHGAAAGEQGEQQHWRNASAEAFAWDAGLLSYECPLFARKFPADTSERVLTIFGQLLWSAGL